MAYWVQKTQATNYLGAFHYNHLGLQGKLGSPRLNPGLSPYRPMLCPSAPSQIRLLQGWEMKQDGQHDPDNRYTVTLAWVSSHTSPNSWPSILSMGPRCRNFSIQVVCLTENLWWGKQTELIGYPCLHWYTSFVVECWWISIELSHKECFFYLFVWSIFLLYCHRAGKLRELPMPCPMPRASPALTEAGVTGGALPPARRSPEKGQPCCGVRSNTSPTELYHRRAQRQGMLCAGPPCWGKFLLSGHEKTGYNISLWHRALLGAGHQHMGFACSGIQGLFSRYLSQFLSQSSLGQHWSKRCSLSLGPETQRYSLTCLQSPGETTAGLGTRDKDF